jgi:hypothetical protein
VGFAHRWFVECGEEPASKEVHVYLHSYCCEHGRGKGCHAVYSGACMWMCWSRLVRGSFANTGALRFFLALVLAPRITPKLALPDGLRVLAGNV